MEDEQVVEIKTNNEGCNSSSDEDNENGIILQSIQDGVIGV